ncbi:MAG TPA: calcium/sodium antiporter [Vicinamibacteria bacterium]|nr:calcium/sodium antiporter [Vicinamibacteria bacterium]
MRVALYILGGFGLLFVGAEVLVRGASRLAALMKIPPVVIGLTVVAFGTSAPELAVSVLSASRGASGIAVGNVVGSNIFNLLAILGLVAFIRPLAIHSRVVWRDMPIMVSVSGLAYILAWDGVVSSTEGLVLAAGLPLFVFFMRGAEPEVGEGSSFPIREGLPSVLVQIAIVVLGLVILVVGSRALVTGSTELAALLGFSELLIGLTLVAAGTSLPELATSLVAAYRKEEDIAVGNVVGSNVFNLLGVLGIAAMVSPLEVTEASLLLDFPVMLGAALLSLVFLASGSRVSRSEGAFLLISFVLYTSYLFLDASGAVLPSSNITWLAVALVVGLSWVIWSNRRV